MAAVTGHRGKSTTQTQGCIAGVSKKRWSILLPLIALLVILAEIALLGRLSSAKTAAIVHSWAHTFSAPSPALLDSSSSSSSSSSLLVAEEEEPDASVDDSARVELGHCEDWLEREDAVPYSRDFRKDPILVSGNPMEWPSCSVGCIFGSNPGSDKKLDAIFGVSHDPLTFRVHQSMESSRYYPENDLAMARRKGYNVIMTTSLSSDVPVGYFSWVEYDIMAPMQPKTEKALAAAFISNCVAHSFRLEALDMLMKMDVEIDSYGVCRRNHPGNVDKLAALKRYKFSLAFENSNEEDYVTEKFFQSLVAGTVPVVIGAPNIQEFAPSPNSVLHIRELRDVASIAKTMKYLEANPDAYNQSLRWKYEGPSDPFKALLDMASVHSSCRLCIHLATKMQEKEEQSSRFKKRPCNCTRGKETVYHLFVRERGRFEMESIFLRSSNPTLKAMESAILVKFNSLNHVPIWKEERPHGIKGGDELKIYRVYPIGLSQRQALYTFSFEGDVGFSRHVESNPCAKFEVIFI